MIEYAVLEKVGSEIDPRIFPWYFKIHQTDTDFTGKHRSETDLLNELGKQHWELLQIIDRLYYFKRYVAPEFPNIMTKIN